MEFDKTRVYTVVNAEDLPIGSKCIFANNVFTLKDHVRNNYPAEILISVCSETITERFNSDSDEFYSLAYLIEPPAEPKYEPFESVEKAMEAISKHGGWAKDKTTDDLKLITSIGKISDSVASIGVGGSYYTFTTFLDRYVFADDGSPCGELARY